MVRQAIPRFFYQLYLNASHLLLASRYAHEPPALHSGVSKAAVDAIRAKKPPPVAEMTEIENTIYAFCWAQYNSEKKRVDQHTWNKVRLLF